MYKTKIVDMLENYIKEDAKQQLLRIGTVRDSKTTQQEFYVHFTAYKVVQQTHQPPNKTKYELYDTSHTV